MAKIIYAENKDLFMVPQGYWLAHCISSDFALGAGIAKQFVEHYNMREKLKAFYDLEDRENRCYIGSCLIVDNVFNLVTKERAYQKPTYQDLEAALNDMHGHVIANRIDKIAMPKIGCGLDRLDWETVEDLIKGVFADLDIEIMICTL